MAYNAECFRSLNDRLGALLVLMGGDPSIGTTLPPLGVHWLSDLRTLGIRKVLEAEQKNETRGEEA